MATFWRKFHHDRKSTQPGKGGGARPPLFHFIYHHVLSCGVLLRGLILIHFPYFYSTPVCTLRVQHYRKSGAYYARNSITNVIAVLINEKQKNKISPRVAFSLARIFTNVANGQ
jgi:hypothetical protein